MWAMAKVGGADRGRASQALQRGAARRGGEGHPDVLEMFFQVFDKGLMDDAEGREIDFRNTVIILTSNAGSQHIMQACFENDEELGGAVMKSAETLPDADTLAEVLRPTLYKTFKPAFVGRTKVVPYYPLNDDVLAEVIKLKLDHIAARVKGKPGRSGL